MGLFGPPPKKGISNDEWKKEDKSKVRRIFGFSSTGRKKANEVERILASHLDADEGTHGRKVLQEQEVDDTLRRLEHDAVINKDQARKIKQVLDHDLRD